MSSIPGPIILGTLLLLPNLLYQGVNFLKYSTPHTDELTLTGRIVSVCTLVGSLTIIGYCIFVNSRV